MEELKKGRKGKLKKEEVNEGNEESKDEMLGVKKEGRKEERRKGAHKEGRLREGRDKGR